MRTLLSAIARTALRLFIAAFIVYSPGILAAPDLNTAKTLAFAALLASFAAVLRGAVTLVPKLSIAHWVGDPWGNLADSFLHAFLAVLLVNWADILSTPHAHGWKDLFIAAIVGAANAGVRAVQGLLTPGEHPVPSFGLSDPPPSPATPPVAPPPPPAA